MFFDYSILIPIKPYKTVLNYNQTSIKDRSIRHGLDPGNASASSTSKAPQLSTFPAAFPTFPAAGEATLHRPEAMQSLDGGIFRSGTGASNVLHSDVAMVC